MSDIKRLEEKIDKLSEKQDLQNEKIMSIDKNLAVYNEQLKIHIEGTVQNREQIKLLKESFNTELDPVKKHINHVEGVLKFLGIVSLVLGITTAIYKLL